MKILKSILVLTSALLLISCNISNTERDQNQEKINTLQKKIESLENENKKLKKESKTLEAEFSKLKEEERVSNEDFLSFIINFSETEDFQKERIEFPIQIEESYIGENDTVYTRTKENWDFKKYKFHPEGFNIYDNEDVELRKSNYRVLRWYGIESEGDLRFYFRGKNRKWFLYKISHSG